MIFRFITCLGLASATLLAHNGDKPGEAQSIRISAEKIPPAPQLSPEDAIKKFRVPAGFEVQLVASEPLIEAPIVAQFDPDGRLYVLEMRGFMPNPDGKGEEAPNGRISILEDTNGDGKMDKRTIFIDWSNVFIPSSRESIKRVTRNVMVFGDLSSLRPSKGI